MSAPKYEISEWRDEGPKITPAPLKKYWRSSTWIGVLGTLCLHALVLHAIPFGSHARPVKPPPTEGGAGATVNQPKGILSDPLILLDLSSLSANKNALSAEIASQSVELKTSSLTVLSVDELPTVNISDDPTAIASEDAVDSGDPALRAEMFGRYTGQIDARIDRAWKRPRSPIHPEARAIERSSSEAGDAEDVFRCQVRVRQDESGNVKEVELLQCDGSQAWRQSLVTAIFASSPLPAPPTPDVFSRFFTLTFTGYEFSDDARKDAYERLTATAM